MKDFIPKQNLGNLIETIQRSYRIESHLDFFKWQQECVIPLFNHDVLIAVWGDFNQDQLNYDVSSHEHGIRTKTLLDSPQNFNSFVKSLHKNWLNNSKRWYRINNLFSLLDASDLPEFFNNELNHISSIMVYGVNDCRGNNDCIYMFLDKRTEFPIPDRLLGLLMPHLDAALRRIECFEGAINSNEDDDVLTKREHEVLHWVKLGKSNTEIGEIMEISLNTVKNHLKHIFIKLDVSTRAHAVASYPQAKMQLNKIFS